MDAGAIINKKISGKRRYLLYLPFLALIAYLLINTGIISDDIAFSVSLRDKATRELLVPTGCLSTPAESVFFFVWYRFFNIDNPATANILKIIYVALSFYLISKFFSIYLDDINAFLASFIFIFFPSHDATVYWFLGLYLTLSMAFYLYAYYLAHTNRFFWAFVSASLASFISYGSPAIAASLFLIFALKREYKKGMVILVPNIIYSFYYLFIAKVIACGIDRLPSAIDIAAIAKQFVIQILTFADSLFGPSMWLKVYYSLFELSALSIAVGVMLITVFSKGYHNPRSRYDKPLLWGLIVLTILSLVMFAATGRYPQLAFNLGNRTTVFGSLLVSYLIVLLPMPRRWKLSFYAVLIFSVLGISDHWKAFNLHQQEVYKAIRNNEALKGLGPGKVIYVSGNQYSKFGAISHVEFLSEEWVTGAAFSFLLKKDIVAKPFSKRHKYEDGYLVDTKYGEKTRVGEYIDVYDSERDKLVRVKAHEINGYINSMPADRRHWVQMVNNKKINDAILSFMPRLKYAF